MKCCPTLPDASSAAGTMLLQSCATCMARLIPQKCCPRRFEQQYSLQYIKGSGDKCYTNPFIGTRLVEYGTSATLALVQAGAVVEGWLAGRGGGGAFMLATAAGIPGTLPLVHTHQSMHMRTAAKSSISSRMQRRAAAWWLLMLATAWRCWGGRRGTSMWAT